VSPGASVFVRATIRYRGGVIWPAGVLVEVVVCSSTVVEVAALVGGTTVPVADVEFASTDPEAVHETATRPKATTNKIRDIPTT